MHHNTTIGWRMRFNDYLMAIALVLINVAAHAQDPVTGRALYISTIVSGELSCSAGACHGPNPANNQNKIKNGDTPGGIAFPINSTPGVQQMAFLKGKLNSTQLANLAAYIADPSSANTEPVAQISPSSLSFASTAVGASSSTQQITISNTGNASLSVSAITSTNGDFIVSGNCTSVAENASCNINVSFSPSVVGARSGSINISHNASGGSDSVSVAGTGTAPAIQVSPSGLSFADTTVGANSASQQFTVTNTGSAGLSLSAITSSSASFQIAGGSCNAGQTLSAGSNCTVSVRFAPTTSGERTGRINLSHNASGGLSQVDLSGTGLAAPTGTRLMIEYLYAPLNYYFITSDDEEKALLDAVPAFVRTGESFAVFPDAKTGTHGLTRYQFTKVALDATRDSHFYTLLDSEKAQLALLNPGNAPGSALPFDEGIDSYAYLPVVEGPSGSCAAGLAPVYRLFRGNVGFPDDPNHRFTTSITLYNSFVTLGWDGDGVKFCVPPQ